MNSMSGLFHDSLHRNSSLGLLTDIVWQVECCIYHGLITPILMVLSICYGFLCFRQTADSKLQTSMFTGMCSQLDYIGRACHCNQWISLFILTRMTKIMGVNTALNIKYKGKLHDREKNNSKLRLFRKNGNNSFCMLAPYYLNIRYKFFAN